MRSGGLGRGAAYVHIHRMPDETKKVRPTRSKASRPTCPARRASEGAAQSGPAQGKARSPGDGFGEAPQDGFDSSLVTPVAGRAAAIEGRVVRRRAAKPSEQETRSRRLDRLGRLGRHHQRPSRSSWRPAIRASRTARSGRRTGRRGPTRARAASASTSSRNTSPPGDQPHAIAELVAGIDEHEHDQVLLGVTGSGKTFTMAQDHRARPSAPP